MFERYTEKARRVIFFARYEASQFGSAYIETERKKNKISNLVLVAAPGFLGILRKALGKESGKLISRQINKDLVLMQENVIREHLAA